MLALFSIVAFGLIVWFLHKAPSQGKWLPAALGLIAAGAIGNFIDRVFNSGGVRDFIVLHGLYETAGCGVAVSDADILKAVKTIASNEGLFICPEGAATLCAAAQLAKDGWLKPDETVLLLNTGCGLKYTDTLDVDVPVLKPGDDLPEL